MRLAVLGVGLIGGSIGLAARARLDAEVVGFDPQRANLERGLELGALDGVADSVDAALDVAGLGARPRAIDAAPHDRLMATVSHLPHVVANALASAAAATLGEESERLSEVGPSFRDATRVAGANPAIWSDIFATNREAVAG